MFFLSDFKHRFKVNSNFYPRMLNGKGLCVVGNIKFNGNGSGGSVGGAWKRFKGNGAGVVVDVVGSKLKGNPGVVW